MTRRSSEAEAEYKALMKQAWELIKDEILSGETPSKGKLGSLSRHRLDEATSLFKQALQINPKGWDSMFALGKIFQRLGQHSESLIWFIRAHEINPANADVAREAGLAALYSGDVAEAVQLCEIAVQSNSKDPGLRANLALAYVLSGQDADAVKCAEQAVQDAPGDEISKTVLELAIAVRNGFKPRPKSLADVFFDA